VVARSVWRATFGGAGACRRTGCGFVSAAEAATFSAARLAGAAVLATARVTRAALSATRATACVTGAAGCAIAGAAWAAGAAAAAATEATVSTASAEGAGGGGAGGAAEIARVAGFGLSTPSARAASAEKAVTPTATRRATALTAILLEGRALAQLPSSAADSIPGRLRCTRLARVSTFRARNSSHIAQKT
jgi:hypothetical protein